MKAKLLYIYIAALCLMTGCSNEITHETISDSEAVEAFAHISTEPSGANTEPTASTIQPDDVVFNIPDNIEVYEKITISELAGIEGINLTNGSNYVNTSEVGNFETTVRYTLNNIDYENTIEYTVSDTTPPTLLNSGGGAVIEIGKDFELNDYVGFADNYDRTPLLTYTGEVDTSACGSYPLTATATDCFGNETTWELNVKVVDEIPEPDYSSDTISFEELKTKYNTEFTYFGIDVSKWQGDIDFEAVKKAGCRFVIMRIGTYYDDYTLDSYFTSNMEKAIAAGLDVGVYIYTTANTEEEARENAKWIVRQLNGQALDIPVVFDWESFGNFQQYEMSINDLNNYFLAFNEELEFAGYSAMLYSSKNFLNNFWYEHSNFPIWLAHYTEQTDYTGEYVMWQMSSCGRIDGIEGDVDFNIFYTDKLID